MNTGMVAWGLEETRAKRCKVNCNLDQLCVLGISIDCAPYIYKEGWSYPERGRKPCKPGQNAT